MAPCSEASSNQVFAIRPLVDRGLAGRPGGIGQHVLLDDDPPGVALTQSFEDAIHVEVALAQTAESLTPPDLRHRRRLADDVVDDRLPRVLEVNVVDARAPGPECPHRIAPPAQEVTGVEAQSDRSQLEGFIDLPFRLDVGARFGVDGRAVAGLS